MSEKDVVIKEQDTDMTDYDDCHLDCKTVYSFMKLTDEMVHTILDLEEELVRWRQALIKYLPRQWAEGLRQDIFNNLSRDFEGEDAYDMYVNYMQGGNDPQHDEEHLERMYRLADGIDETSIDYL